MRRLLFCLLFGVLAGGLAAQDLAPVTCPDGTSVTPQLTISLPAQPLAARDALPEPYFVSVLTEADIPTLATSDANTVVTCAALDGLAQTVSVSFDDAGTAVNTLPTPYSAWVSADRGVTSSAVIGNLAGTTFVVIEGGTLQRSDKDGDVYTLSLSPEMIANNVSLSAYVLNVDQTDTADTMVLSVLDDDGQAVQTLGDPAACADVPCSRTSDRITAYTGLRVPTYNAVTETFGLALPQDQAVIHLRVDHTQTDGSYTLIVKLDIPQAAAKRIPAQAIDNGDGSWTVLCDGAAAFENGVKLTLDTPTLTADAPLTLTALGTDSPLTLAVMTSATEGFCIQQTPETSVYSLALPDLTVQPTLNSAQAVLTSAPAFVVVGTTNPSPVTLVLEGWTAPVRQTLAAEPTPPLDALLQPLLTLSPSPGLISSGTAVRAYAIAADDLADPAVGFVDDSGHLRTDATGQALACNNAGVPDECQTEMTSLNGFTATIAAGRVLPGASLDAMVQINLADLAPQADGTLPSLHINAADRTGAGGSMVLVVAFALTQ